MKLISTTRQIEVYNRIGNTHVFEIPLTMQLVDLKQIVKPKKRDPLMYDGYKLSKSKLLKLLKAANVPVLVDLKYYIYVLTCTGIYDWNEN